MATLNTISGLDRAQLSIFIPENIEHPEFVKLMTQSKFEVLKVLLAKKFFHNDLLKFFEEDEELSELANIHIECNFTPSNALLSKLAKTGAEESQLSLIKIFDAFPSLPVSNEYVFEVINFECFKLAIHLIVKKNRSEKGILLSLFKAINESTQIVTLTPEFEAVLINHPQCDDLMSVVLSGIKSESIEASTVILEAIAISGQFEPEDVETICKGHLSAKALRALHGESLKSLSRWARRGAKNSSIPNNPRMKNVEWTEEVEKLTQRSDKYLDIDVINPPKTSKYWDLFVVRHPEMLSDADLLEAIKGSGADARKTQSVVREIIENRSLDCLKKVNLKNRLTGDGSLDFYDLTREIHIDTDKAEYLYEMLDGSYLQARVLPFLSVNNKQVAYKKMIESISDTESVREILDAGYSLKEFIQELKKDDKNNGILKVDFLNALKKDEFLMVMSSGLQISKGWGSRGYGLSLKFSLSNKEITPFMVETLSVKHFLKISTDPVKLFERFPHEIIELGAKDIINIIDLYEEDDTQENCLKALYDVLKERNALDQIPVKELSRFAKFDKELSKTYLASLKLEDSYSEDELQFMCQSYTFEEINSRIDFCRITFKYIPAISLELTCKDGKFLIPDDSLAYFFVLQGLYHVQPAIRVLLSRNSEIFKEVAKNYLLGIEDLYRFAGVALYQRRNQKKRKASGFNDFFKDLLGTAKIATPENAEKARALIAKGATVSDLVKLNLSTPYIWSNCDEDQVIELGDADQVPDKIIWEIMKVTKKTKLKMRYLSIGRDSASFNSRLIFEEIGMNGVDLPEARRVRNALSGLDASKLYFNLEQSFRYAEYPHVFIELEKEGIRFKNHDEIIEDIIAQKEWKSHSVTLDTVSYLDGRGLMFTDELVKDLLSDSNLSIPLLRYISNRLGGLSRFRFKSDIEWHDSDVAQELISCGAQIVSPNEYDLMEMRETILSQGAEFDAIDVSSFTIAKKIELIHFIEDEVDPNYKKLNLASKNLSTIDIICSYMTLKESVMANNEDIIRIFSIPVSVANNKKLLQAITEHVYVNPTLPQKVVLFKHLVSVLSESAKLDLDPVKSFDVDDYFDRSGFGGLRTFIAEKEEFEMIPLWAIQTLIRSGERIAESGVFMRGQDKKSLMRFLRSANGKNEQYLIDIFDMMKTVEKGLQGLFERSKTLSLSNGDKEEIDAVNKAIESTTEAFAHFSKMDDIELMHDRLSSLASTMAQDPFQPLNQDHLAALESKDKSFTESIGVKLFFPKKRGDLLELGNTHGWCVSGTTTYGDEVISKGNILVALVPKNKEVDIANVVALAHYINDPKSGYYLEQLRWSKVAKKGASNVDATKDFDHAAILSSIKEHLKSVSPKERKAA